MAVRVTRNHAGAVFLGDGEDGKNCDQCLADLDAGEAQLGRVLRTAPIDVQDGCGNGADRHGDADGDDEQPPVEATVRSLVHSARTAAVTRPSC